MHEQSIVDEIVSKLDTEECRVIKISLIVDEANLRKRLLSDIANKIRTEEIMDKSIARIQMYQVLDTVKIDTSNKSVCEITEENSTPLKKKKKNWSTLRSKNKEPNQNDRTNHRQ